MSFINVSTTTDVVVTGAAHGKFYVGSEVLLKSFVIESTGQQSGGLKISLRWVAVVVSTTLRPSSRASVLSLVSLDECYWCGC